MGMFRKPGIFQKLSRLFVIKTRWEAFMIIYALALGAVERGSVYITRFPGWGGKLLFLACTGAVFMAGAKILDCIKYEKAENAAKVELARLETTSEPEDSGAPALMTAQAPGQIAGQIRPDAA